MSDDLTERLRGVYKSQCGHCGRMTGDRSSRGDRHKAADRIEQLEAEVAALSDFICWYVPDETGLIDHPEGPSRYDLRADVLDSWFEDRWERWVDIHGDDQESDDKFSATFETFLTAAFARGELLATAEDGA